MDFSSDNAWGAAPELIDALIAAGAGCAPPYGDDEITERLQREMARIFEREVWVYPAVTGTAANALALATLVPPQGAILCHAQAHIAVDECGAPEFFTHGAKLVAIDGPHGKLSVAALDAALSGFERGSVHHPQPAAVSLTQATERGTCYRSEEIAAVGALCRRHGLKLHLDGARFANAIAFLGCTPAEASWHAGVDVLSFGATKNGALCAEAVVFFNPDDVRDFEYRRKKSGHLLSKMRFVSAQLVHLLEGGRWLALARRANALATRLADGLAGTAGAQIAHPVEANAVFVRLPDATVARLRAAGARFYDWEGSARGSTVVRFVTSFATPEAEIARCVAIARDGG